MRDEKRFTSYACVTTVGVRVNWFVGLQHRKDGWQFFEILNYFLENLKFKFLDIKGKVKTKQVHIKVKRNISKVIFDIFMKTIWKNRSIIIINLFELFEIFRKFKNLSKKYIYLSKCFYSIRQIFLLFEDLILFQTNSRL